MNPVLRRLGGYPLAALQDLARQLRAEGTDVFDFTIGDPVEPTAPHIRKAAQDAIPEISQYPTAAGLPELREAIATWVHTRFGVVVDPHTNVLPSSGSKEAIFHTPLALLDPTSTRTTAIWGSPGYQPYERGALFAGGRSHPVTLGPENNWELDLAALAPDELEQAFIAWVNYPHNPTGATVSQEYLRAQLHTARTHGVVLGSDECYVDVYPASSAPPPSLLEVCDGDLSGVLVYFSLSKRSGMTGYRSGAVIGDPDLIAAQRLMRPNIGTGSPEFVQRAAIAAWEDEPHVAHRRDIFDVKRQIMLDLFDELNMTVSGSDATFYIWVRVPEGDDSAYAAALLEHQQVMVSPGSTFGPGGAGWLRVALVPDANACVEAANRWRSAVTLGQVPSGR